jgi:hypothetical protein
MSSPLLRRTLIFVADSGVLISIRIYTSSTIDMNDGWWNLDNNQVLLSDNMYNHFRDCTTQKAQRRFFDGLRKVSSVLVHM